MRDQQLQSDPSSIGFALHWWIAQRRAGILFAILVAFAAAPASADCDDEPGPGVDWSECEKARLMMAEQDFSGGSFVATFFTASDLRGGNLAGADLTRSDLSLASLAEADLSGASLEK